MALSTSSIQSLLGTSGQTPVSGLDLLGGNKRDFNNVILSNTLKTPTNSLTKTQGDTISELTNFVKDAGLEGPQADKILKDIESLRYLFSYTNKGNPDTEQIFDFFTNNPSLTKSILPGSFVNQLI